jgi:hypothetical protein
MIGAVRQAGGSGGLVGLLGTSRSTYRSPLLLPWNTRNMLYYLTTSGKCQDRTALLAEIPNAGRPINPGDSARIVPCFNLDRARCLGSISALL